MWAHFGGGARLRRLLTLFARCGLLLRRALGRLACWCGTLALGSIKTPLIGERGLIALVLVARPEPGDFQRPHSIPDTRVKSTAEIRLAGKSNRISRVFRPRQRPNSYGMRVR
jgi:hypothetical protein